MDNKEYVAWIVDLFKSFQRVLNDNGVVLWNVSYGNENTEAVFLSVADIIRETDFTVADVICWKKKSAMPNNCASNKLTRIWEFVYVFCKKKSFYTFAINKKVTSERPTGQKMYENVFNMIEADNNDGICPFNRSTYSTDLCRQLLRIYAKEGSTVYDPFMGSGTTAVACVQMGLNYVGSELSANQVKYANERIDRENGITKREDGCVEKQESLF